MTVRQQSKRLPEKPGVYVFRDAAHRVLYVGKAKNLRRRTASYFRPGPSIEPSKRLMVRRAATIDTTITSNEAEALLLEATLIRTHHPPYNIVIRDDTNFLYIRVTTEDEFPTVEAVRHPSGSRSRYFGPFPSAASARTTVRLLKRLFAFRTCTPHQGRPCFDVHLGRCLGPCADAISSQEYHERVVKPIVQFLSGQTRSIQRDLRQSMAAASAAREYEEAARLRDQIAAIERVTAHQNIVSRRREQFDVLSLVRDRDWAAVNLFPVRDGTLGEKRSFLLEQPAAERDAEILGAFLEQYYAQATDKPKAVYVGIPLRTGRSLATLLGIRVAVARRGKKRALVALGEKNAAEYLERRRAAMLADENRSRQALEGLMRALALPTYPERIEAFDISNIQGRHAVGSMVTFERGVPQKSWYRKFTIRSIASSDDPKMMAEVITRRLKRTSWPTPQLMIIDGGKPQLSAVLRASAALHSVPPFAALAKREEELFLPRRATATLLTPRSPELFLIQRIRDEAHRFAISFYRSKHRRASVASALDDIPGIGIAAKRRLLQTYGSIAALRMAPRDTLRAMIGARRAAIVHATLHHDANTTKPR